jgi:hypothetical protein
MLSRIRKENQNIYINNEKVLGVQSFTASYAAPIEQVKSLGMDNVTYYNNQNTLAEINISKLLIDKDEFVKFLDYEQGFSGHIDYKNKYFAFNSGILTRYNLSCEIGEIPQVNLDISAIGDFGGNLDRPNNESLTTPNIDITDYSNIEINLDDFKFNRLQSFTLNISAEKNIIYTLGSVYPKHIKVIPPILVEIEFTIKADDYNIKNIRDLICKYKVDNFKIIFNKFKNPQDELFRFDFSEALFVGESFAGSVDSSSDIKIKYHAFIYNKRNPPISNPLPLINAINENSPLEESEQINSQQLPIGDTSSTFPNIEENVKSSYKLLRGDAFALKPQEENSISTQTNLSAGDTQNLFPEIESGISGQMSLSRTGEVVSGFAEKEPGIFQAFGLRGKFEVEKSFPELENGISNQNALTNLGIKVNFPKVESEISGQNALTNLGIKVNFPKNEQGIFQAFGLGGKFEVEKSFPELENGISGQLILNSGDTQDLFPEIESGISGQMSLSRTGEVVSGFAEKEPGIFRAFGLRGKFEVEKSFPDIENQILKQNALTNLGIKIDFPIIESEISGQNALTDLGVKVNFPEKEPEIYKAFGLRGIYEVVKFFPNLESNINKSTKIPKDPKD